MSSYGLRGSTAPVFHRTSWATSTGADASKVILSNFVKLVPVH